MSGSSSRAGRGDGERAAGAGAARGLGDRVEIRDRFIPNDEAALLFGAAHASLLPYRSASQSGVVQLSFAYGCPVIATRVGGLPAAVGDGVDGILCEPSAADVAAAIERMAREHELARRRGTHRTGPSRFAATASCSTKRSRGSRDDETGPRTNSALAFAGDARSRSARSSSSSSGRAR